MAVGTDSAMPLQPIGVHREDGRAVRMAQSRPKTDRAKLDGHHAQDRGQRDAEPLRLVPDECRGHVREDDEGARQRRLGEPGTPRGVPDHREQRLGARAVQRGNPGNDSERRALIPIPGQEPTEVGRRLLVQAGEKVLEVGRRVRPVREMRIRVVASVHGAVDPRSTSGRPVTLRT